MFIDLLGQPASVGRPAHLSDHDVATVTRRPDGRAACARYYLLDPEARERFGDWATIAAEAVATRATASWRTWSANSPWVP